MMGYRGFIRLFVLMVAFSGASSAMAEPTDQQVSFQEEGAPSASIYEFGGATDAPPIILFHMAGSNSRGEYAQIAPRLIASGFRVFGADLPSGGERFGFQSLMPEHALAEDYCGDYRGLAAVVDHVAEVTGKRPFLIGSSYSAALVMKAAVNKPDSVSGFVSLSPAPAAGLEECAPSSLLAALDSPGLGIRPRNEVEYEIIREQAREWASHGVVTKVVEVRSHGASALDPSRSGKAAEEFWPALLHFLKQSGSETGSDG